MVVVLAFAPELALHRPTCMRLRTDANAGRLRGASSLSHPDRAARGSQSVLLHVVLYRLCVQQAARSSSSSSKRLTHPPEQSIHPCNTPTVSAGLTLRPNSSFLALSRC